MNYLTIRHYMGFDIDSVFKEPTQLLLLPLLRWLFKIAYQKKSCRITAMSLFFIGSATYLFPTNKHQHQTAIRMSTSIIMFKNTPLTSYTRNKKSITGLGREIFIVWPKILGTNSSSHYWNVLQAFSCWIINCILLFRVKIKTAGLVL
jgi:hypothetical protein